MPHPLITRLGPPRFRMAWGPAHCQNREECGPFNSMLPLQVPPLHAPVWIWALLC